MTLEEIEAVAQHAPKQPPTYSELVSLLEATTDVLLATILFHSGGPWTNKKQAEWVAFTGQPEASTKSLCDTARHALTLVEDALP